MRKAASEKKPVAITKISPWGDPLQTPERITPLRRRGLCFLLSVVLLAGALAVDAPGVSAAAKTEQEIKAEIAQIEKKIAAQEKEINRLREEQSDQEELLLPLQAQIADVEAKAKLIDGEIARLNTQAAQLRTQIKGIEKDIAGLDAQMEDIEAQTKAKDAQIREMQQQLQNRLRKQYMDGPVSNLQLLLASPDLSSMLTVSEFLKQEAANDELLRKRLEAEMAQMKILQGKLNEQQDKLDERKLELQKQSGALMKKVLDQEAKKKELDKEQQKISAAETEITSIINGLKRKTKNAQQIIAQQRKEQEAFERELDAILAAKFASGEVSQQVSNNGQMIWPFPYKGCYITSEFGATSNRTTPHKGMDISIADKSKSYAIIAALDGVIAAHGWDKYMGNYVMIYHGYYAPTGKTIKTTYMHLASFDSGVVDNVPVKAGKVLGIMGSTGNSTGPHLHFQINEYTSGTATVPVNPRGYLGNLGAPYLVK
ncbi:MAG: peptidoglycan DD-metalloendopeptidase family protein [Oscillospiraceae bacterium]|jgi:murein DD-endopeptidase MepM/ murein hydrolase activator NlpD|nr:peptidoglycan DD-metalloendopeptidase family protein [Oscillospiraceae bacterium]